MRKRGIVKSPEDLDILDSITINRPLMSDQAEFARDGTVSTEMFEGIEDVQNSDLMALASQYRNQDMIVLGIGNPFLLLSVPVPMFNPQIGQLITIRAQKIFRFTDFEWQFIPKDIYNRPEVCDDSEPVDLVDLPAVDPSDLTWEIVCSQGEGGYFYGEATDAPEGDGGRICGPGTDPGISRPVRGSAEGEGKEPGEVQFDERRPD